MNQAGAKEQKRQIRRAFGPDALEVLTNRDQAIAALQHRLQQLEMEVAGVGRRTTYDAEKDTWKCPACDLLGLRLKDLEIEVGHLRNRVANLTPKEEELSLLLNRNRIVCDERFATDGDAHARILKRQEALFRDFRGRMRWLFLGR